MGLLTPPKQLCFDHDAYSLTDSSSNPHAARLFFRSFRLNLLGFNFLPDRFGLGLLRLLLFRLLLHLIAAPCRW